ncbi:NlpC/P60 family protein [Aminobacter sp. HY435]|uniref:NlpC/P60 family protein n=1 Tax=Aminobacter sp. HY435 TaxID=2970917 RepID=UPI0022B982CE|nr:NlpC/P60 family protein [Aminobacter sp. HY435]
MKGVSPVRPAASAVVREAMEWVGTPYRHQGCRKRLACDCLGLVLGIWRELYGSDLPSPGPYAPDWAEATGEERLLDGLGGQLVAKPAADMAPGDVIVFRWRPHLPAKHAGILTDGDSFVHAYQGNGVTLTHLVPQWRRRIAAAFAFPDIPQNR